MTKRTHQPTHIADHKVMGADLSEERIALMNGKVDRESSPSLTSLSQPNSLAGVTNPPWTGTSAGETYTGDQNDDSLDGAGGNDILNGAGGNDTLKGGAGADQLNGGADDDTYYVDFSDTVTEAAGQGRDTVILTGGGTFTLSANSEVEELRVESGTAPGSIIGNNLKNLIIGNDGQNGLDGGGGGDTLIGGYGDDAYTIRSLADVIIEKAGEGTDSLIATIDFVLKNYSDEAGTEVLEIEKLYAATDAANRNADIDLTGNFLANELYGNDGANILDGGQGADTMAGGLGSDTYYVDNEGDVVTESSSTNNTATDKVYVSSKKFILSHDSAVEELYANRSGSDNGVEIRGSKFSNTIYGGSGNDVLYGDDNTTVSDSDRFEGKDGDDTYYVDSMADIVFETSTTNSGNDTVVSELGTIVAGSYANVENFRATENNLDVTLISNASAHRLVGNTNKNSFVTGGGSDTLEGGKGNDTYTIDFLDTSKGEKVTIIEREGEGIDTIMTGYDFVLEDGVEVEVLRARNDTVVSLTGNNYSNEIIGNAIGNILDGGAGADRMLGGLGNDVYYVDNAGDGVVELANEGNDEIIASASYTIGAGVHVETLTAKAGAGSINLTGNSFANTLKGNEGSNILDGGAGVDILEGGDGDDTYIIDNDGDSIIETSTGGFDTAIVSVSTALSKYSNIEALRAASGTQNIDLTGDLGRNRLTGNDGNNVLDGGAGADTMRGGAGNDTYYVDDKDDLIVEAGGDGSDKIIASASYKISDSMEVEILEAEAGAAAIDLTGNSLANTLTGNNGSNVLNGGAGADILTGGKGNDTYIVDDAGDMVVEDNRDEGGNDKIVTSVNITLGGSQYIETVEAAAGAASINLTGNAEINILTGNDGANVLNGGLGADVLTGGRGNDTYIVDDAGDVVVENIKDDGGLDRIITSVSLALADTQYVEILEAAAGASDISLTGNAEANTLIGNDGNNNLNGGLGADTMRGGKGNDTYTVNDELDKVVELDEVGTDLVKTSVSYSIAGTYVEDLTATGTASISLTGNGLANMITGNTGNNRLDGGAGADTLIGDKGDDVYVVDDSNDVVVETIKEDGGNDKVITSVGFTLGAAQYIEILEAAAGTTSINLTGNAEANILVGNDGANVLNGGLGADTLTGGRGNDTYVVRDNDDTLIEVAGEGIDTALVSGASFELARNVSVEILQADMGAGVTAFALTGNNLANTINGASGKDTLDGGGSATDQADSLKGGDGDDTYYVRHQGDIVTEVGGEGNDKVLAFVSYALANGTSVEVLEADASAGSIALAGNSGGNELIGNSGDNVLEGKGGDDILDGKGGVNTAVFTGSRADYTITRQADGSFIVTDNTVGRDGTDTLTNIKYARFSDDVVDLQALPELSIEATDAVKVEGDSGATQYTFTVTRNSDIGTSKASWRIVSSDTSDFQSVLSGTVDFAVGETSKTITVTVKGDKAVESNEAFSIELYGASGATVATGSASGLIINDDVLPVLSIAADTAAKSESDTGETTFTYTVSRDIVDGDLTVAWKVEGFGPNGADASDFVITSGNLVFENGHSTATITILVKGDKDYELNEDFIVSLGAISGGNATVSDSNGSVMGTIINDDAPAPDNAMPSNIHVGSGGTIAYVDENKTGDYLVATVKADDDGSASALRYGLSSDIFEIDAISGQIRVKNGLVLNHETQSTYTVTVTATDLNGKGLSTTQDITIKVNDVNERASDITFTDIVTLRAGSAGVGASVATATADDPDAAGSGFTTNLYRFDNGKSTTDDGLFVINANTGQITTARAVAATDVGTKTLNVVAYDAANPALTYVEAHTVTILSADNDAPEGVMLSRNIVNEKSAAGTVVAILSGLDPQGSSDIAGFSLALDPDGKFEIVGNELRVRVGAVLDYENKSTHAIKIKVTDKSGASTTQDVTINVADVNERPVGIQFDDAAPLKVGVSGAGADVAVAQAVDRDASDPDFAINLYRFDNGKTFSDDGLFTINTYTGEITTTRAVTAADVGTKKITVVTYDASDSTLFDVSSYTVNIVAADDTKPTNVQLTNGTTTASVDENKTGSYVATVTANDDGGAADLRYGLSSDIFEIDTVSGQIRLKDGISLNYEGQSTYTVTVTVTDLKGSGQSVDKDITINVTDQLDVWRGGAGKDVLTGTAGRDIFYGNYGNDVLTGGAGQDIFVFNSKLGNYKTDRKVNFDTIVGYSTADDVIHLENAIFKKLKKTGTLSKSYFVAGSKAKDKNDYVGYDKKSGLLWYDADGSGSGKSVEIGKLSKGLKMTHVEFIVI